MRAADISGAETGEIQILNQWICACTMEVKYVRIANELHASWVAALGEAHARRQHIYCIYLFNWHKLQFA